jgi:hypothetical protein
MVVEDECSSTCDSTSTQTTSSTVPGLGSLSGKAIKALGNLTLRGIDRVIISAQVNSILSKFPHTDDQVAEIKDIDDIYDRILELSR